jgi:alpha-L-fucosidase 2
MFVFMAAVGCIDAAGPKLQLSHKSPAATRVSERILIGGGSLGATVFGGVRSDRVMVNEQTIWSAGP